MFGLGGTELFLIVVLFAMVFGLGKLPQAARQLGLGVRNFKDSMDGKDVEDAEVAGIEDQSAAQAVTDAATQQTQKSDTASV